jgi:hypothetical protein
MTIALPRVPNGKVQPPLRAANACQNTNDLVRAAVGWNAMFGAPASRLRGAYRMRRPPHPGITPSTTGINLNHAPLGSRSAPRASI